MKSYYDRKMDVLSCPGCGASRLMSTRAIFNQQRYIQSVETFAARHEFCKLSGKALRDAVWGRVVSIMEGRRTQA
jgi:hypothetical protein